MAEMTLVADGIEVSGNSERPDLMRLRFSGGGDAFNVIMQTSLGQVTAQAIDDASVQSKPAPIGPDELRLGATFRLLSLQVRPTTDGGRGLVLLVEVADGVRSLPIVLSKDQVDEMISDLSPD